MLWHGDARKIDDFFSFDQILLDAPCSGSGTISLSNPKLEEIFTPKLIEKSVENQTALLKKAIQLLKSGKEMVYSTCSILAKENEEVLEKILKKENIEIVPISKEHFQLPFLPTRIEGTLCVSPNELYEGFFIAKIRKKLWSNVERVQRYSQRYWTLTVNKYNMENFLKKYLKN